MGMSYPLGPRNFHTQFPVSVKSLGSFSNDDGDGSENVRKDNNFARASRFFVHFSTASARLQRENA